MCIPSFPICTVGAKDPLSKKEMTLDCDLSSRAVKGHFSSLLLSNIIGYLTFLQIRHFPFFFETYLAALFSLSLISLQREALLCGSVSRKGCHRLWAQLMQMILFLVYSSQSEFVAVHNLFASGILSPEDLSNGLLTMLFALLLFCRNLHLLVLPVSYMIIGLTSLCLYNITGFAFFQDGILYKLHSLFLCKTQKSVTDKHVALTTG